MPGVEILNVFMHLCIKPTIVLLCVLYFCTWNSARSPHSCHWGMVVLCLVAVVCLPIASLLPDIPIPIVWEGGSVFISFLHSPSMISELSVGRLILYVVFALYCLVLFSIIGAHQYDFFHAHNIVNDARAIDVNVPAFDGIELNRVSLKESHDIDTPVIWGEFKPVILLPVVWREWSPERIRRVLMHELAHQDRKDWFVKNTLVFVRAAFWFIPPIWTLVKRADLYAEYACDDSVIRNGESRAEYATDLLELSSTAKLNSGFVAIASSELALRINLILDGGRERAPMGAIKKCAICLTALILILPIYSVSIHFVSKINTVNDVVLEVSVVRRSITENPSFNELPLNVLPNEHVMRSDEPIARRYVTHEELHFDVDVSGSEIESPKNYSKNADIEQHIYVHGVVPEVLIYPQYPRKALREGIEAELLAVFDISKDGKAKNIRINTVSTKERMFVSAIKSALQESQFSRPMLNGQNFEYLNAKEVFVFKLE